MGLKVNCFAIPIALVGITVTSLVAKAEHSIASNTGTKGAKIYCFMRNTGNDHEVSWKASYSVIKRQNNSLFKTSPRHAAVMITESVVQNPNDFENCGSYLGDLFGGKSNIQIEEEKEPTKSAIKDRYKY